MNYLHPLKFIEIADDGIVTADELIGLADWTLNGDYPGNGVTRAFMDLTQFLFDDWGTLTVSLPENYDNVILGGGTIKSADGKSSITLTTAAGTSNYVEGLSSTQTGSYSVSMSLASGVTFSLVHSSTYSDDFAGTRSGSESANISYKDTNETTDTSDDIVISRIDVQSFSESDIFSKAKGTQTYSYTGNGFTISHNETWDEDLNFSDVTPSGTGTYGATYAFKDVTAGVEIAFKADSSAGMIDDGTGSKSFGETVKLSDMKVIDPTFGKITTTSALWSFSFDSPDLDIDLVGTLGPDQIAFEVVPFVSEISLVGSNAITLNNINGLDIDAGAGNDTITGGTMADTISDGAGNDSVSAGDGDDTLYAGLGNDTLNSQGGDDVIHAGEVYDEISDKWLDSGKDVIDGGAGNDLVVMSKWESNYSLSKLNTDLILTNSAANVVTVKNTVERIQFSDGGEISVAELILFAASETANALYQRGSGIYDKTSNSFTPTEGYVGPPANIDGLAGNDTIFGTNMSFTFDANGVQRSGGDILRGGEGADSLSGFLGADFLDGGAGSDVLNGGLGADLYIVDSASDIIQGEGVAEFVIGKDVWLNGLQVKGLTSYTLAKDQHVEYLSAGEYNVDAYINGSLDPWIYTNTNAANITGNDFNQWITGNAAINTLNGAGGDDSIWGADGNDILVGGLGNDTLDGGVGNDSVSGGDGDDVVVGDFGNWSAITSTYGYGGKDTLDGGAGNDFAYMQYSESSYTLSRSGTDLVLTNVKNANSVTTIRNTVEGIKFYDTEVISLLDLNSGVASDTADTLYQRGSMSYDESSNGFAPTPGYAGSLAKIDGLGGNDTIYGTDAVFTIETQSGPRGVGDNLQGGVGSDSLVGFAGDDLLDGGAGNDTLNGGEGTDLYIVDSVGDVIQGEETRDPLLEPLDFESGSPLANFLQVKGATNYKLTSGQYVEALFAGEFSLQAYESGLDPWTFANTNVANITGNEFSQLIRGNAAINTLDGSGGDDSIWGADGNDILVGGLGNDTLDGGVGNDSVSGGDGDDVVVGDFGNWSAITSTYGYGGKDTLDGGAGNDFAYMQYSESSYTLSRSGTDLVLTNVKNANSVTTIKNTVEGIKFYDTEVMSLADLTASKATKDNDILYQIGSGTYSDSTKTFALSSTVAVNGFSMDGLGGDDRIYGTTLNDTLSGGDGADSIESFDGNDKLNGGAGRDTLIGGSGIDHYFVDDAGDVIIELSSDDLDQETFSFGGEGDAAIANVSYGLGVGVAVEDLLAAGIWTGNSSDDTKVINLTGNERDNGLIGNSAANKLDGGLGNDDLFGGAGNDILLGGSGDDMLIGGLGNDSLDGGAGNDGFAFNLGSAVGYDLQMVEGIVALTGGTDTMIGGAGSDVLLVKGTLDDYTFTRSSSKEIRVTTTLSTEVAIIDGIEFVVDGIDFNTEQDLNALPLTSIASLLSASAFDDNLSPRDPTRAFVADGLAGNDTLTGTEAFGDTLRGGDGNDSLVGSGGDDSLDGGVGNDALLGGAGQDTLFGGAGNDTMTGGTGHDRYWIDSSADVVVEVLEPTEINEGSDRDEDVAIVAANWTSGPSVRLETLIAAGELASKFLQMSSSVAEAKVDITGNAFDESIIGSGAANKLDGGAGNDFIFGSDGADTLLGGTGDDSLAGGAGNDSLAGGTGNDVFLFNQDIKLLDAGAGFTIADGLDRTTGGNDTVDGGEDNDIIALSGFESDYTISRISQSDYRIEAKNALGLASKESVVLRNIEGLVFTGSENDVDNLQSMPSVTLSQLGIPSDFDDNLSPRDVTQQFDRNGGKGNDTIVGSLVGDRLEGGDGNDSLVGGGGNDTLMGGIGNDTLVASRPSQLEQNPTPGIEMITMDGGAGDDVYVIDDISADRSITLTDSAGNDTVRFNVYGDLDLDVYIDGASKRVHVFVEQDSETPSPATPAPLMVLNTGLIEAYERNQYDVVNGQTVLTDTVRYNAVYAALDAKTGVWNAKGTDKNDLILAATGGANIYDGGKGDDLIMVWGHAGTVVQGGEGFNDIDVRFGIPGQDLVTNLPIGTLSYAWSSGGVEVNMSAGIGVAYDAKGEEVLGVDQFDGLANVLGGKGGDSLVGDDFNNVLDGSDGNDTLSGGGGLDVLIGGAGNDTFVVNLQDVGTVASERVGATANASGEGNLLLSGGTDAKGTDTLVLQGLSRLEDLRVEVSAQAVKLGMSTPAMDPGANSLGMVSYTVLADRGIEQVSFDLGSGAGGVYVTNWGNLGTKGDDLVLAKAAGGYALGGLGNDLVLGGSGEDVLLGGLGNDVLVGRGGEDRLLGGAGNDTIRFNILDGDIVLGGAGSDTYVIGGVSEDSAGYASRVLDFRLNEDFLRFEGYGSVSINAGTITATKGMDGVVKYGALVDDPDENLLVRLDSLGNLDINPTASPGTDVQLVGISGIDTQAELAALMSRVMLG